MPKKEENPARPQFNLLLDRLVRSADDLQEGISELEDFMPPWRAPPNPSEGLPADLLLRFAWHLPTPSQAERCTAIHGKALELAELLVAECPPSREQALALTNLEQTVFWANSAIARRDHKE